jgi:hypothetical protein
MEESHSNFENDSIEYIASARERINYQRTRNTSVRDFNVTVELDRMIDGEDIDMNEDDDDDSELA